MNYIEIISNLIIPAGITAVVVCGMRKGVDVFDVFAAGAKEGLRVTVDILPSLIGLMMAISMMKQCGMIEIITGFLKPMLSFIGMPGETFPLAMLRPVSGSASMGIVSDIFASCGADSYAGRVASVMMGATETTFYTIALFYGSVGIKRSGRTVAVALAGDFAGLLGSVIFSRIFF